MPHEANVAAPSESKAFPDESLRLVVYRMADTGLTRLRVVQRDDPRKLVGIISLNDLLKARVRNLEDERRRERVLTIRFFAPRASRRRKDHTDTIRS